MRWPSSRRIAYLKTRYLEDIKLSKIPVIKHISFNIILALIIIFILFNGFGDPDKHKNRRSALAENIEKHLNTSHQLIEQKVLNLLKLQSNSLETLANQRYDEFSNNIEEHYNEYKQPSRQSINSISLSDVLADVTYEFYKSTGSLSDSLMSVKQQVDGLKSSVDMKKELQTEVYDTKYKNFKKYKSFRLIWFGTIRNDYGVPGDPTSMISAGQASETIEFIIPLCKKYSLFGWVEEVEKEEWKRSLFYQELSPYEQSLLEKCNERGMELLELDSIPGIGVLHFSPRDYTKIRDKYMDHVKNLKYVIGRSVFETNNVPSNWAEVINANVAELWVPSKFLADVFSLHAVRVPVKRIGEGFDPAMFNSSNTMRAKRTIFPTCKDDDFVFVTAGKNEDRKGYDILLKAFSKAFDSTDKVCLAIRASGLTEIKFENPSNLRTCNVERLPYKEYVKMYKSADAYISASHGEGWGRPIFEAMAMGLPTIAPYWAGIKEYSNKDVILPIKVEQLEKAFPKEPGLVGGKDAAAAHLWAKVDTWKIRDAMKWVFANQEEAKLLGKKAEAFVHTNYNRDTIADTVLARINQISENLQ